MGYIYNGGTRRVLIWSRENLDSLGNWSYFDFLRLVWYYFLGLVRSKLYCLCT